MLDTTWIESSVFWRTRLNRWILKEHSLAAVHAAGTGRKIITAINWVLERPVTVLWNRRMWKNNSLVEKMHPWMFSRCSVCVDNLTECQNNETIRLATCIYHQILFFMLIKLLKIQPNIGHLKCNWNVSTGHLYHFWKLLLFVCLSYSHFTRPIPSIKYRCVNMHLVTIKLSYVFFDLLSCLLFFNVWCLISNNHVWIAGKKGVTLVPVLAKKEQIILSKFIRNFHKPNGVVWRK